MMHVYYCTTFKGHNPVGTCAIVVARNPKRAAELLNVEIKARGLPDSEPVTPADMSKVDRRGASAEIVLDGNY